jgi:two-component system, response regulator PdtaR
MITRVHSIVVAEDEPLIRMLVVEVLIQNGFEVLEACHAEAALVHLIARAADIHVLFTDVTMPGTMNGLALAHHTRGHWPWIGLIIASGRPVLGEMPVGSRFLAKPYLLSHAVRHARELIAAG